jgi:hypothetical protein
MYSVPLVVTWHNAVLAVTGSRQRQHARPFEAVALELILTLGASLRSRRWRRGWELGTYGSPDCRRQFCRKPR